jgi:hypothetical protein
VRIYTAPLGASGLDRTLAHHCIHRHFVGPGSRVGYTLLCVKRASDGNSGDESCRDISGHSVTRGEQVSSPAASESPTFCREHLYRVPHLAVWERDPFREVLCPLRTGARGPRSDVERNTPSYASDRQGCSSSGRT